MEINVLTIAREVHLFLKNKYYGEETDSPSTNSEMGQVIKELSDTYNKYNSPNCTDFNNSKWQAAYMYLYFSHLCHSVKCGLNKCGFEPAFFPQSEEDLELNICSIGGGPGTNVLGFYRYMRSHMEDKKDKRKLVLNATIVYKYCEWEEAWNVIDKNLKLVESDEINMDGYIRNDVSNPPRPLVIESVSKANVILMFKFLTEVQGFADFDQIKKNLINLLRKAPRDSYLIYGDNSAFTPTSVIEEIATEAGFEREKIFAEVKREAKNDGQELADLESKYGNIYHQRDSQMCFMVWKMKQVD